jgi:hypothetical protein
MFAGLFSYPFLYFINDSLNNARDKVEVKAEKKGRRFKIVISESGPKGFAMI